MAIDPRNAHTQMLLEMLAAHVQQAVQAEAVNIQAQDDIMHRRYQFCVTLDVTYEALMDMAMEGIDGAQAEVQGEPERSKDTVALVNTPRRIRKHLSVY